MLTAGQKGHASQTTTTTSYSGYTDSDNLSYDSVLRPDVVSERPVLPPDVLFELRRACALILRETGPSEEDYAAILNQPDPLENFTREQRAIRDVREQASASQTSLPIPFQSSTSRKRDSKHLREDPRAANRLSSKGLPPKSSETDRHASKRRHSKSLPPVQNPAKEPGSSQHDHHSQSRSKSSRRPLPQDAGHQKAAAAPSNRQTWDQSDMRQKKDTSHARPRSERPTHAPRNFSTSSHASEAPIPVDEIHPALRHSGSRRKDERAPEPSWIAHDNERRNDREKRLSAINPDYTHIPTLHPEVYRPPQPSQPTTRTYSRPQSRAGEMLGSLRDGIRDYIMPRPSLASTRFQSRDASRIGSRSASRAGSRSSSRPASRGSLFGSSGRNWFGLRRKNSWSSFRSGPGPEDDEGERQRGRDKGPDLNRSLPPLPGLDQYKEPKTHIAHLLAKGNPEEEEPQSPVPNVDLNAPAYLKPQEVPMEGSSPDIGPTPPAKSNPRSPLEKRPPKQLPADERYPIGMDAAILPTEKRTAVPEKRASTRTRHEPASVGPAPPVNKKSRALEKARESDRRATRQQSEPQLDAAASHGKSSMDSQLSNSAPVRTPSDSVRLPFSKDDSSTPASRVISTLEPDSFLDRELARRLHEGTDRSQLPITHEAVPVYAPTTQAEPIELGGRPVHRSEVPPSKPVVAHPAPMEHADITTNEGQSFAALGVDRTPPVLPKAQRAPSRTEAHRTPSALGSYDSGDRVALKPRDSVIAAPARGTWLRPADTKTREIVGAGALVGLEDVRRLNRPQPLSRDDYRVGDDHRTSRTMTHDREWYEAQHRRTAKFQQLPLRAHTAPTTPPPESQGIEVQSDSAPRQRKSLRNRLSRLLGVGGENGRHQRLVTAT